MDIKCPTKRNLLTRRLIHILSILLILAFIFPAPGQATPAQPTAIPRIVASLTFDWFEALEFASETPVHIQVFDALGGTLLWEGERLTDTTGKVHIGTWEHPVDLVPGVTIIIEDGVTMKELTLEAVTLDVFDPVNDILSGTVPPTPGGRWIWVEFGYQSTGCGSGFTTDPSGVWSVDFGSTGCDVTENSWAAAQIYDADNDISEANPYPNPFFVIFPEWDWFDGNGWPSGLTVDISVAGKPECTTSGESFRYFFNGDFPEACDIVFGDVVTFSNGITTRTHTVRVLEVTAVDLVNDTVSGLASPGAEVDVWPHATDEHLVVTADLSGIWLADFSGIFDIVAGEYGRAAIWDGQGNATEVEWGLPSPHMVIFPEYDFFDGLDWQDGTVDITVAGKPVCSLSQESWDSFFNGNFPEGCDVAIGDTVSFTDGVTTRTHTIFPLGVTAVDLLADTVAGTAGPGAEVHVWPHATGQELVVVADPGGNWQADFSGLFDIVPGEFGRSVIWDAEGNGTAVDWGIPNPHIVASLTWDWFESQNFAPAATVHAQIFDAPGGTLLWEADRLTDSNGYVHFGTWEHPVDLVPGVQIILDDGTYHKELTLEDITLDVFDPVTDFLAGTAPAPYGRRVWVGTDNCSADLTSDPVTGAWEVDFSLQPCDVTPGTWGAAQVFDADGDVSEANRIPNPSFVIFPEWNAFDGNGWPTDITVDITVAGRPACTTSGESYRYYFSGSFPEGCDIEPGDVVTFTDGATVRTHTVQNLAVTDLDLTANTVAGTADPGAEVHVWPHATGDTLVLTAGLDGSWLADFTGLFDIVFDEYGRSAIYDAQGNSTAVDWGVPNPHFAVDPTTEWFDGLDWPDGALVEISVVGEPICALVKESWDHFFNGNFPEGCDLEVGDVVTFTDGVTERTHTVRELAYGVVDIFTDIAQGTAEEDATVYVWAWDTGIDTAVVATGGQWLVDFGALGVDLVHGMGIRAEIRDVEGNATMVDYWIPNPRFTVFPEWEWFDGLDWPDGATVDINVAGKPVCTTSQVSSDFFFNGGFPEGCDIMVGDVVTFTDGHTLRTHTVRELAVSGVDKPGDSVAGTSTAGAEVYVWPHDGGIELQVSADASGDWLADFSGQFDIEAGQAGRSEIRDAEGNATAVDWYAMYDLCLPVIFNP